MARPIVGSNAPHGTRSRYSYGCRCDECRAANTAYRRDRCNVVMSQPCRCGCGLAVVRRDGIRGRLPDYLPGHRPGDRVPPEEYFEQLARLADAVIVAVHDEGPDDVRAAIHQAVTLPHPAHIDPHTALVTVLAAQVDPDAPISRRLGWVEALATGAPEPRPAAGHEESAA